MAFAQAAGESAMQTSNRLFDDFAKVASGALHTLGGLREEIETRVRERIERMAADMNLVSREEFDAVQVMAAKARDEQESMAIRLEALEAELATLKASASSGGEKPRMRKKAGGAAESGDNTADAS
jgi:BMFP domain-containing protein YqiC